MNSHCSLFLFGEIFVPRMTMRTLEREIHVCKCLQTYMIIWTVRMERSKNQHWWKEMSPALKMEAQLAAGPSDLQCSDGCFTRKSRFFFSFYRPHPFNVYSLWFHMAQFGAESFFDEKMAPACTAPRLYCALLCCCNTHEWNLGYTGVSNWNKIKMGGEVGWGALPPFPVNQLSCQFSVRETPGDKHSSDSSFKLKMERCLETKTRSPSSCLLWTTSDWQVCML